jgi:nucleotide-binding universal stress UspA family protein
MDESRAKSSAQRLTLAELKKREAAISDEEVERALEEARRKGLEEPGRTTALVPDPRATSPQAKAGPPTPSKAPSSTLAALRKAEPFTEERKAELRAMLAEAERRGMEEPGRISVLVPPKRV